MEKYEALYILTANLEDSAREAEIEKYSECVKSMGGTVDNLNKWGVKRLAYPINFKNDGYYVLMTYSANADVPAEVERRMRLSDNVVRFMTTKAPAVKAKTAKKASE